jgi:hypothetical protein
MGVLNHCCPQRPRRYVVMREAAAAAAAREAPPSTPARRAKESARWQRDIQGKEMPQRILLCGWRVGVAETCFELDQVCEATLTDHAVTTTLPACDSLLQMLSRPPRQAAAL